MAAAALGAVELGLLALRRRRSAPAAAKSAAPPAMKKILILGGTGFLGPKTIEGRARARTRGDNLQPRQAREVFCRSSSRSSTSTATGTRSCRPTTRGPRRQAAAPRRHPQGSRAAARPQVGRGDRRLRLLPARGQGLGRPARAERVAVHLHLEHLGYDENRVAAPTRRRGSRRCRPDGRDDGHEFQYYGGLKVLCEQAAEAGVRRAQDDRAPRLHRRARRPDRSFTYWPVRVPRGGEVLVPGTTDDRSR